jgi:hypothetical protein
MSEPLSYPPEAVLTKAQVAEWLQVSEDLVDRLNIKSIPIGERKRRYLAKHVLEALERESAA